MADFEMPDDIRDATRAAWQRYLDLLTPFRPDLHRYCRKLTGNVWDAEDLAQDTLVRAFASLGYVHRHIDNPRGYLLRTASNLWIDAVRRRASDAAMRVGIQPDTQETPPLTQGAEVREAGAIVLQHLMPQERAAVVMKEVFDMSLEEIASVLSTTVGAIKAALHRGRARLRATDETPVARGGKPSAELVDRFVACLNAADLKGLLALMLDTGSVEELGNVLESGRNQFAKPGSWLFEAVNVHPELPAEMRPPKYLNERVTFQGEFLVISYLMFEGQKLLMSATRFEEQDERIARLRAYNFCPETLQELAATLGITPGQVPYRFPTPSPGRYWWDPA